MLSLPVHHLGWASTAASRRPLETWDFGTLMLLSEIKVERQEAGRKDVSGKARHKLGPMVPPQAQSRTNTLHKKVGASARGQEASPNSL